MFDISECLEVHEREPCVCERTFLCRIDRVGSVDYMMLKASITVTGLWLGEPLTCKKCTTQASH